MKPVLLLFGLSVLGFFFLANASSVPSSSDMKIHICDLSQPCGQNGQCIKESYGYRCECEPGYSGEHCEYHFVHICDISQPCGRNGQCIKEPNGYRCQCEPGYSGEHCEHRPAPTFPFIPGAAFRDVQIQDQGKQRVARDADDDVEEMKQLCEQNKLKARTVFSDKSVTEEKWKALHPAIKAVLMDVVANDDYKVLSRTHAQIKKAVAGNDLLKMSRMMAKRGMWKRVPLARFWKRRQMMKEAVKNPWSSLVENDSC